MPLINAASRAEAEVGPLLVGHPTHEHLLDQPVHLQRAVAVVELGQRVSLDVADRPGQGRLRHVQPLGVDAGRVPPRLDLQVVVDGRKQAAGLQSDQVEKLVREAARAPRNPPACRRWLSSRCGSEIAMGGFLSP